MGYTDIGSCGVDVLECGPRDTQLHWRQWCACSCEFSLPLIEFNDSRLAGLARADAGQTRYQPGYVTMKMADLWGDVARARADYIYDKKKAEAPQVLPVGPSKNKEFSYTNIRLSASASAGTGTAPAPDGEVDVALVPLATTPTATAAANPFVTTPTAAAVVSGPRGEAAPVTPPVAPAPAPVAVAGAAPPPTKEELLAQYKQQLNELQAHLAALYN